METTLSKSPTLPTIPPPGTPLPLERIGRYRILQLLGRGGMGMVYLAEDSQLRRQVALKVPTFSADENPAVLERFYREARTAARLQHPNICPVFDVDEVEGTHYLTMAYIEGDTLAKQVPTFAAKPPRDAATLVRVLALALDEAHRQGIIHRDLKPSNIMMNRRGEPVVMDFGLAREIKAATSDLSHPGMVMGTPAYMAPEQARGDMTAIGPGCDIYSLGVVLYQLLTGRMPFDGSTMEVIAQHLRDDPPPPSTLRSNLDSAIEAICLKAMAKEPSRRFLSMAEFAQDLERYLSGTLPDCGAEQVFEDDPFRRALAEALVQFRSWGWKVAAERINHGLAPRLAASTDSRVRLLLRLLRGDGTAIVEAKGELRQLRQLPALIGWARLVRFGSFNTDHDFALVSPELRKAQAESDPRDNILQAEIATQEGFYLYHAGKLDEALNSLHRALDLCGRDHFLTGGILELLGKVYATKDNFHAAEEIFHLARSSKESCNDPLGRAHVCLELGRLYLSWGELDRAEEQFQQNLIETRKHNDVRGAPVAFNFLGLLALKRGERAASIGRKAVARRHWNDAAELLDVSIRDHKANHRPVDEAYARNNRARVALAAEDLDTAEEHLRQAEALFKHSLNEQGLAFVHGSWGVFHRHKGDHGQALSVLQHALTYFDRTSDFAVAAKTQFEIARTLVASGEVRQLCTHALLDALKRAERCRRAELVERIEEELKAVDEEAHSRHVFHRARGRHATIDTGSLEKGETELASVLFLNLDGFVLFCQGLDSADVMRTLNQMMADLVEVLEHQRGFVTAYLGGGFMALVRGHGHAERAVQATLDMIEVVNAFNRPRAVLGLRQLPLRIGIASGSMFLGNIGTYSKMDFTAVGMPVNLAARVLREALCNCPCITRETFEMVRDRFEFAPGNPRSLDLPYIGQREVWDVLGRKKEGRP